MGSGFPEHAAYQLGENGAEIEALSASLVDISAQIAAIPIQSGVSTSNNPKITWNGVYQASNSTANIVMPYSIILGVSGKVRVRITAKKLGGAINTIVLSLLKNDVAIASANLSITDEHLNVPTLLYFGADPVVTIGDDLKINIKMQVLGQSIEIDKIEVCFDKADWPGEVV